MLGLSGKAWIRPWPVSNGFKDMFYVAAKCKAIFFFSFSEKGNLKLSLGKQVTGDFGFLFLVFGLTLFLFFYFWHGSLCLVSNETKMV